MTEEETISAADSETTPTTGATGSSATVFVVSPIGTPGTVEAVNASLALEYIIRQALPMPKWKVIRADEEKDPGSITHKVIDRIVTSDLIVADLTDCNPNVFYELAVAHGYKRPVVTLMTSGQKVPFDIVDMRTVFYDLTNPASVHSAKQRLRESAEEALGNPAQTNPLVTYEMFSTASNAPDASPGDKLEFAVGEVLRQLGRIESRMDELESSVQFGASTKIVRNRHSSRPVQPFTVVNDLGFDPPSTQKVEIRRRLERIDKELSSLESSARGLQDEIRIRELQDERTRLISLASDAGIIL